MRKHRTVLTVAIVVGIGLGWLALPRPAREPEYEGYPLSYWLLARERLAERASPQAQNAVREVGTNAIPVLLRWMRYEIPAWRQQLRYSRLWGHLGSFARESARSLMTTRAERLADASAGAFKELGPEGRAAIPALIGLMDNTNAPHTALRAMLALGDLGTNGLAPLVSAMQDRKYPLRFWAVSEVSSRGATPDEADLITPPLLECLTDTSNPYIPLMAAMALGRNRQCPSLVVPYLIGCLTNSSAGLRLRRVAAGRVRRPGHQRPPGTH
jgi:hypothetical protein